MWIFLILIGTLLIVINVRALRKEENSFKNVLQEKEVYINDYAVEILEIKREIEELKNTLKDYDNAKNIEKITSKEHKEYIQKDDNQCEKDDNQCEKEEKISPKKEEIRVRNRNKSIRVLEIDELLKQGLTIDEVAEKLNINKGEALLIKELYLK